MSLIENTLEKMRRDVEAQAPAAPQARSAAAGSPSGTPHPAPLVMPAPPAYIARRIAVDMRALRSAGYVADPTLERRFDDHFRQIKRPLIDNALAGSDDMRQILVSSALPGDGKTFTCINLALSVARERDVSVLLVDADSAPARVSEVFGMRRERGLIDALSDESLDVESLVVSTDVRGLEILPAGRLVDSATELYASKRMDAIAARLCAHNPRRLIVIDSAPLLASSEARALLRVAGQVVLVVRVDVTSQHAVAAAAAYIDKKKFRGVVLNHVSFRGDEYYGYSGYGEDAARTSDSP